MKVFINPSYGASTIVNGVNEREITLKIGQRIADHLKANGFETELQQLESVEGIYTASNNFNANVFVAIHCNSADPKVSGTETFFCQGSVEGPKLAEAIQKQIISTLEMVDRGIKDDTQSGVGRLAVLRKTACPAVLVEIGFISNVNDAKIIIDRQEDFAKAIANGVMNYCGVASANIPASAPKVEEVKLSTKMIINLETIAATSRKFESNNDLEYLSTDSSDKRYGLYGLSSSKKTINEFVEWLCNHSDNALANYGKALADHEINSEAFIDEWKNLTTVDPGNFGKLQDEFVKKNYFDKAVDALAAEYFHADKHSDAIKSVIFARAIDSGVNECVELFKNACKSLNQPNLSYVDDKSFDEKLINEIYNKNNSERFTNERNEALTMLKGNSF